MTTLAEKINVIELPQPVNGEALLDYARRVAYIGALTGEQHALIHQQPVAVYVPTEPPVALPPTKDDSAYTPEDEPTA